MHVKPSAGGAKRPAQSHTERESQSRLGTLLCTYSREDQLDGPVAKERLIASREINTGPAARS